MDVKNTNYVQCRACSGRKRKKYSLQLKDKTSPMDVTLFDMILFCVPQVPNFVAEDYICKVCVKSLEICFEFIKMCLKTNKIFNNAVKTNISDEVVDNRCKEITVLEDPKIELCEQNEIYLKACIEEKLECKIEDPEGIQDDGCRELDNTFEVEEVEELKPYNNEDIVNEKIIDNVKYYVSVQYNNDAENVIWKSEETTNSVSNDLQEKLSCEICSKTFNTKRLLNLHVKLHKRQFICGECGVAYTTARDLKKHISCHCEICREAFQSSKDLDKHMVLVHTKYECQKCGSCFFSQAKLTNHEKENENNEVCNIKSQFGLIECPHCSRKFLSQQYSAHLRKHSLCICEICGKCLPLISLKSHKITHNDPNTVICSECGKGFKHDNILKAHLRDVHNQQERTVKCDYCPKMFLTASRMRRHRKYHLEKQFSCPTCAKKFFTKDYLEVHERAVHLKLKPFSCSHCGFNFSRKDKLKEHVINMHSGKLKGRGGNRVSTINLKNTGVPCKCHLCGRVSTNLNQLKAHLQQVHLRIKRFKCQYCDLTFTQKHSKVRHEMIHSDPTFKFRCNVCYKKNTSDEELNEHMKKHTNFPYQCNICSEKFPRRTLLVSHKSVQHTMNGNEEEKLRKRVEFMDEALKNIVFVEKQEASD